MDFSTSVFVYPLHAVSPYPQRSCLTRALAPYTQQSCFTRPKGFTRPQDLTRASALYTQLAALLVRRTLPALLRFTRNAPLPLPTGEGRGGASYILSISLLIPL